MNLDPAAPDPPLLSHPFASVRDLDPGTVDGDDDILGEELRCYLEREIQALNPAEEDGIVSCPERVDECRELSDKPSHLMVGHLQEGVDAGYPHNEGFGILIRPIALASVHPGKDLLLLVEIVKREIEFSAPHRAFIIYSSRDCQDMGAPCVLWHGRPAEAPVIFIVVVG